MKYLVVIFAFCFSMSSYAQQLNTEPIELPQSLSFLKLPSFQDRLNTINELKTNVKPYTFTIDELDRIRSGHLFISTKSFNNSFTFLGPSTIDLRKELRKVMLAIPGQYEPVTPKGFTL